MSLWLVLDGNYLGWRAHHTTGRLSHDGDSTGVAYGVFRDIMFFTERFATDRIIFSFDHAPYHRGLVYAGYKKRPKVGEAEMAVISGVRDQINLLRDEYLPELGYRNVYHELGYESDDVIATVVKKLKKEQVVIISSDKDLYQLLSPNVSIWSPSQTKVTTLESFQGIYHVTPEQWPEVKAIAGCLSDCIKGVPGVGEVLAARYVNGLLKRESKAVLSIQTYADVVDLNRKLVTLPFPGLKDFKIVKHDYVTIDRWKTVMDRLGMKSLKYRWPNAAGR